MKKFTKFEQAQIKSTAKTVYRFYQQKEALDRKVDEYRQKIEMQKAQIDVTINAFEASVKALSGGFTTKDLCMTEMVDGKRRFTMKPQDTLDLLDNPSLVTPAGEAFEEPAVEKAAPVEETPSDVADEEPEKEEQEEETDFDSDADGESDDAAWDEEPDSYEVEGEDEEEEEEEEGDEADDMFDTL